MTRDENRNWIGPHSPTDRPCRATGLSSDLSVCPGFSIGDFQNGFPDFLAVRRSIRRERKLAEIDPFPVKILLEQVSDFYQQGRLFLIAPPSPIESNNMPVIFTDGQGSEGE